MKLLFFTPSLEYSGVAKQLTLLAAGLPRVQFTLRVCVLGGATAWTRMLQASDVEVETLNRLRLFDVKPWPRLHRAVRDFHPDVIHVWGLKKLWPGLLLRQWAGGRLVISGFSPLRDTAARLSWLDQQALRSSPGQFVVSGPAEAERGRRLGVSAERVIQIPPGVTPLVACSSTPGTIRQRLGFPADARILLSVGPLLPHKGYRDAVWAFDILKYLYPNLRLVFVGAGPERSRLEQFANALNVGHEVCFVGLQTDLAAYLNEAEIVWVPSPAGGINAALEAIALGKPVVAARTTVLAEIVTDGITGALFTPGDKAALARQTRALLDNLEQRTRVGEAARQHAASAFSAGEMVQRHVRLYEGG